MPKPIRKPVNKEKKMREDGDENSLNILTSKAKSFLPLRKYERTFLPI
jgi:hypothetical protein